MRLVTYTFKTILLERRHPNAKLDTHEPQPCLTTMSEYRAYKDRDWLYERYINRGLSGRKIAMIYGYCADTVRRWIKKFKLTQPVPIYRNKSWLYQKYWVEGLSTREIAQCCGTGCTVICRWLRKLGIPCRAWNWKGIQSGDKHSSWRSGVSSYWRRIGYNAWDDYWNQKVPDGYLIHHVDRDITNNDISNLALVTSGFHAVTHKRGQYKRNRRWFRKP